MIKKNNTRRISGIIRNNSQITELVMGGRSYVFLRAIGFGFLEAGLLGLPVK